MERRLKRIWWYIYWCARGIGNRLFIRITRVPRWIYRVHTVAEVTNELREDDEKLNEIKNNNKNDETT